MSRPVAVTTGEPAGIGPEVTLKAALAVDSPLVLLGSRDLLEDTARRTGLSWPLPARVAVEDIALAAPAVPGTLDVRNAAHVIRMLGRAVDGAMSHEFSAVCTGPVQKSILTESGHPFTGHTEFFRDRSGVDEVVMMLVSDASPRALRVALVTTHLALRDVADAVTAAHLSRVLDVLDASLRSSLGIAHPRICCTGLNPHAGENGHMGREEIEIIIPTLAAARARGIDVDGPWPADTAFVRSRTEQHDCMLCMYHDQGLPVLKREGFGHGANLTLGLPWVRTSVDHGTALDIAGRGIADSGSMITALRLAVEMAGHRGLL